MHLGTDKPRLWLKQHLQQQGSSVAVRSEGHQISSNTDVYIVDTLGYHQSMGVVRIMYIEKSPHLEKGESNMCIKSLIVYPILLVIHP